MLKTIFSILLLMTAVSVIPGQAPGKSVQAVKPTVVIGHLPNANVISLPKPVYPAAAAAVRASGTVRVAILIDEQGNVEKAEITSGHPLLNAVALNAALQARFIPAKLSDKPVKARTEIQYHFGPDTAAESQIAAPADKLKPLTEIPVGPVNERAKILPMPQLANAVDFKGTGEILVRVKIDFQKGEVLDAEVESGGHPLVKATVLRAAKGAKFEPALPEFPMVRGSGFISYHLKDFNKPVVKNENPRPFLIIAKGDLNSRAKTLPKPTAVKQGKEFIAGRVEVNVLISSFEGGVVAVSAVSGPEELRKASENAAVGAKFAVPHINGGGPIYVKGSIVYTFWKNGKVL